MGIYHDQRVCTVSGDGVMLLLCLAIDPDNISAALHQIHVLASTLVLADSISGESHQQG